MNSKLPILKKLHAVSHGFTTTSSHSRGFTLIELLVVIGVLTTLLAIVLVAVNPARQFSQANNTQRRSDVLAILNAVQQYAADNRGQLPAGIDGTVKTITSTPGATNINLCAIGLLVPNYIADLPLDPKTGTETPTNSVCTDPVATYSTGYTITTTTSNRVTVAAPGTEVPPATGAITITR